MITFILVIIVVWMEKPQFDRKNLSRNGKIPTRSAEPQYDRYEQQQKCVPWNFLENVHFCLTFSTRNNGKMAVRI